MAKIFTTWTLNKEISLLGNQNVETTIAAFESSIPASSLMAKFFTTWTCGILVRLVIRKEGQFESTEIAVENSMKHAKIIFQNYLRFNEICTNEVSIIFSCQIIRDYCPFLSSIQNSTAHWILQLL